MEDLLKYVLAPVVAAIGTASIMSVRHGVHIEYIRAALSELKAKLEKIETNCQKGKC